MHIAIVGGGLVGLGTARALREARPDASITVIEKEDRLGAHQSTHNSGVLHAGLYYKPGSSKARLAVEGIRLMRKFCEEHDVAHETCGKLVVATTEDEVPRLRALEERGRANGLTGIARLGPAAAREREPSVRAVEALVVPEEGIVDYAGVVNALERSLRASGVAFLLRSEVRTIDRRGGAWRIEGSDFATEADLLVTCAGLQSDRVARLAGVRTTSRIVPCRGEYYELAPEHRGLVRHLIYPVPDPAFPFLGVHYTRMIGGGVECGPNAVLALAREALDWRTVRPRDVADTLAFPGVWRFLMRHGRVAFGEIWRSLSREAFVASLQRLVPDLRAEMLIPGGAGVRAQAMRPDGSLVEDFELVRAHDAVHVINAPSPAATASLAIGKVIAEATLEGYRG